MTQRPRDKQRESINQPYLMKPLIVIYSAVSEAMEREQERFLDQAETEMQLYSKICSFQQRRKILA